MCYHRANILVCMIVETSKTYYLTKLSEIKYIKFSMAASMHKIKLINVSYVSEMFICGYILFSVHKISHQGLNKSNRPPTSNKYDSQKYI